MLVTRVTWQCCIGKSPYRLFHFTFTYDDDTLKYEIHLTSQADTAASDSKLSFRDRSPNTSIFALNVRGFEV